MGGATGGEPKSCEFRRVGVGESLEDEVFDGVLYQCTSTEMSMELGYRREPALSEGVVCPIEKWH
jgi:hypothetical protein